MLTAYLDHLQHAPAAIQVASCLLGSLSVFAACFAPGMIAITSAPTGRAADMAAPLSRGTRIGRPRTDGRLVPGTVLGPAFGEGFYRAELRGEDGPRIVCLHVDELVVEPAFGDLRAVAAAMRACDRALAPAAPATPAAGPRRVVGAF